MSELDQLKEVIQKANPEIMELKFGCEVDFQGRKHVYSGIGRDGSKFFMDSYRGAELQTTLPEGYTTLGRPIRLADVLLAVKRTPHVTEFSINEFVNFQWDLLNDNLDNQSEETKQFLIDLLVPAS